MPTNTGIPKQRGDSGPSSFLPPQHPARVNQPKAPIFAKAPPAKGSGTKSDRPESMKDKTESVLRESSPAQQAVVQMAKVIATANASELGSPKGKANLLQSFNSLSPMMDPTGRKAFKELLTSMGISEQEFNQQSSGQFSATGLPVQSTKTQTTLNMSKSYKGKKLSEKKNLKTKL